jgi:septal ring factor EnvC (AmiA/AmiB activator)
MARRRVILLGLASLGIAAAAYGRPAPEPATMPATAEGVLGLVRDLERGEKVAVRRLDSLRTESERLDALVVARGRAYVRMARTGLLPVGGGFAALVDHAARLERLRRALARDLDRQESVAKERRSVALELGKLRERLGALETERAALERSHVAIEAAEEREEAFRRAFLSDDWHPDHTAVYGSGVGPLDPTEIQAGFAAMKGRLPFPVTGRTEIKKAERPGAGGTGLEMGAAGGSVVRAVYPGRVAFADSYAEYGRTVIVDHGTGYYTVSAGLGTLDVRAGDEVRAGDTLGKVDPGASSLYFEIRHGADTVDPSSWFGI